MRFGRTLLTGTEKTLNCACINDGEIHIPHLLKKVDSHSNVTVGE